MSSDDRVALSGQFLVVNGRRVGIVTGCTSTTMSFKRLRWWQRLADWARRIWGRVVK